MVGMPILGFMLSIVKPTWMLAPVSMCFSHSIPNWVILLLKYLLFPYCSPIMCLTACFGGHTLKVEHVGEQVMTGNGVRDCFEKAGQTGPAVYTPCPSINPSVRPPPVPPCTPFVHWEDHTSASSARKTVKSLCFPESTGVVGAGEGRAG